MSEITAKEMFLRCFEHKLTDEDISSIDEETVFVLSSPSSFKSIHETNRIYFIDAINSTVIRFYNENEWKNHTYIAAGRDIIPPMKDNRGNGGKRYHYCGGESGSFNGCFSKTDRYFRFSTDSYCNPSTIDSIPNWEIAHFLCDYLNNDEITRKFAHWVFGNAVWNSQMKTSIGIAFKAR